MRYLILVRKLGFWLLILAKYVALSTLGIYTGLSIFGIIFGSFKIIDSNFSMSTFYTVLFLLSFNFLFIYRKFLGYKFLVSVVVVSSLVFSTASLTNSDFAAEYFGNGYLNFVDKESTKKLSYHSDYRTEV